MPKAAARFRSEVETLPFTLEEHLQRAEERAALLADFFQLYGLSADAYSAEGFSAMAAKALSGDCRALAMDMRFLLRALRADVLNEIPNRHRQTPQPRIARR